MASQEARVKGLEAVKAQVREQSVKRVVDMVGVQNMDRFIEWGKVNLAGGDGSLDAELQAFGDDIMSRWVGSLSPLELALWQGEDD